MTIKQLFVLSFLCLWFIGFFLGYATKGIVNPKSSIKIIEITKIQKEIWIAEEYQRGEATWYGEFENGKVTASGQVFDMNELTVAHADLPFGTEALVKNRKNGKKVWVIITDRMPEKHKASGRIIDLSFKAAQELDMIKDGHIPITIYVLKKYGLRDEK